HFRPSPDGHRPRLPALGRRHGAFLWWHVLAVKAFGEEGQNRRPVALSRAIFGVLCTSRKFSNRFKAKEPALASRASSSASRDAICGAPGVTRPMPSTVARK